jgi:carbonic anhydrase
MVLPMTSPPAVNLTCSTKAGFPGLLSGQLQTAMKIAPHEHVINMADTVRKLRVTLDVGGMRVTRRNEHPPPRFHFHTPGEPAADVRFCPMEARFVPQSASAKLTAFTPGCRSTTGPSSRSMAAVSASPA